MMYKAYRQNTTISYLSKKAHIQRRIIPTISMNTQIM